MIWLSVVSGAFSFLTATAQSRGSTSSGKQPARDVWSDPSFFPIAVWLQEPGLAAQYKKAGFNTYVGLWEGPTEEQLTTLRQAGMQVICEQNEVALRHLGDPTIIGWMHGDEPDNAQPLHGGKGYGPPVPPDTIISLYRRIKAKDPSRPVMLNLGQGVAWDDWIGRGVRNHHPEDYPEYMKGGDIVSFDIYPAAASDTAVSGKLWYVAKGVDNLVQWAQGKKMIWNCIECTHIGDPNRKATPHQVRAEVWMSIIHGSHGLIYFVHQFQPKFNAAALLDDPEMLSAVTGINRQIGKLAPVLNSPNITDTAGVRSGNIPVATMLKKYHDTTYLFAVAMREGTTTATFTVPGLAAGTRVAVWGEHRMLRAEKGDFRDTFQPWDVHIYRLDP